MGWGGGGGTQGAKVDGDDGEGKRIKCVMKEAACEGEVSLPELFEVGREDRVFWETGPASTEHGGSCGVLLVVLLVRRLVDVMCCCIGI